MKRAQLLFFPLIIRSVSYAQRTWFNQEKDFPIQFIKLGNQLNGKTVWLKDRDILHP